MSTKLLADLVKVVIVKIVFLEPGPAVNQGKQTIDSFSARPPMDVVTVMRFRNRRFLVAAIIPLFLASHLLKAPAQGVPPGDAAGTPWTGNPGVTETVQHIMDREAKMAKSAPAAQVKQTHPRFSAMRPRHNNPSAPAVSQWPPSASTGGAPGQPLVPQIVGTSFLGAQVSDTVGYFPPDSMADVGTNQIIVCVNGRIRTFTRQGVADGALDTTTDNFFASVLGASSTSDPRVRFDRLSGRWFITMITVNTPNFVLIAASSGPTITSASSFTFYSFQADASNFGDYDTLGVDSNALYVGLNIFKGNTFANTTAFVVNKANLLTGTLTVTAFTTLIAGHPTKHGPFTPQGVNNDDPAATEGYFIGVDSGSFGTLVVRRISNPGGTPSISGDILVTVPATSRPLGGVPAQGSTSSIDDLDDRLMATRMHNGSLWTAHNIQVDSSGIASSTGGRDGSRWYQLANMTGTPTVVQSGTLFDPAGSNPRNFWIPSCAMSGQGHMALGCSVAGNNEHAEIATAGRFATDPLGAIQPPTTAVSSASTYNIGLQNGAYRWGDFSVTTVDPSDDMTIWTVQEYCNANNSWGVQVIKLLAPPPATPTNCSPAMVAQGTVNLSVTIQGSAVNGTGFFDPGTDFPNHITASVNGGGVTVNTLTYNNPTSVTANLTIAPNAAAGARTVTITNPDGQSATSASAILTITSASLLANFSATPTNGMAPLTVSFTNLSSGAASFDWDFGDGHTSTGVNPVNTYSNAATYTVRLVAIGAGGTNSLTRTNYILVTNLPPPVTDFLAGPTNGAAPLTVYFTNLTSGATNFAWSFGDGNLGTTFNPTNVYTNAGSYTVSLTAIGPGGTNSVTRTNFVIVTNPPPPVVLADFAASPTNGLAPLTVSTGVNPVNTYSNAATYTVRLVAAGAGGTNSLTRTNYILVTNLPPPVANFLADPTNGAAPLTVHFTNLTSGATNFAWSFGDGNLGTTFNPTNTYTNAGSYTVSLTAIGPGGTNSVTRTNFVIVTNPPPPVVLADFTASPTNGLAPLTVTFTNLSSGAASFDWDFGDRNSSTNQNPGNIYTNAGTFSVTLTAAGAGGTNLLTRTNYIVVIQPAQLVVTPASLDFGLLETGATNQAALVVSNAGADILSGSAAVSPGSFALLAANPFNLTASAWTNLMIEFMPTNSGHFSNVVILTSNGGASTNVLLGRAIGAPLLLGPSFNGTDMVFSFGTVTDFTYLAQYKDFLSDSNWQTFESLPGDGTAKTITNSLPLAPQRFFRLLVQ